MTAAMCDRELKMDISVDISFLTASKLFLLPLDYPFNSHTNFHKDKDQMSFRDAIKQVRESKKEKPNKLMERVAKHCLDTFVTNPLMIDYTFWKENKDELTLSFHPADFCQAFFAMNYIQQPKHVHDIYDFFGSIFFRVSRCFEFSNNFDIELNVGDVNKTCFMIDSAWKSERIENGLLTKFHRIFMSNIADYCGLLTSFVSVVPLMEKNCDIPCWMFSNVLLNTGIWKNYEQYIYSSTLINGSERVKELLDVYLVSGGIWDDFQVWGPQKFTLPSRNSLIIWLHRLFLSICYPAIRDPNAVCFEYSPMTLQVFLLTLTRLYKLGVPAHWLSSVIETLLSTSKLSTAVKPPSSSPLDQSTAATSNITSSYLDVFQQELSCLLSIWSRHPDISFPILYSNLPDDIHTFIVTDVFIPNTLVTGTVCCPHLAMLLIHPEEEAIVEIGQFYNHVKTKKGSRRMHLFSCLKRWKNGDISFSASKSFIDGLRMENWMVIPLRIDSWKMVSLSGSVAGLKQMD